MEENNTAAKQLCVSLKVLLVSLDQAESVVKSRMSKSSLETLARLSSYKKICLQQLELADQIQAALTKGDWDKVTHDVGLINGLAEMVKDDARNLLGDSSAAIAA